MRSLNIRRLLVLALALVPFAVLTVGRVTAAPEPAQVPQSWELQFEYLAPQRIEVSLPGEDEPHTYWYLLYTVSNDDRDYSDVQFMPYFTLMTDTMKVYRAEIGVHPAVYDAIKYRHRKTHPFLSEPVRAIGRLRLGEDNARDSVAIWPDFDPEASSFTIYVGGLSGETERIRNFRYNPAKPEVAAEEMPDGTTIENVVNPKFFTVRKTLVLDYELPGNPNTRDRAEPKLIRPHHWTMR